ncbi:MAG: MFS transporter, partial [Chloroflexota bacterium]|nr:MFS transporter [Chloroflexota bacterium]
AIALNSIAFNISRVAGPAVGGLLIALFGPGTNFFIQAACYVAVALAVFPMRVERQDLAAANQRDSVFANLREGLNYVAKEQTTLALIVLGMIPSLLVMPFITGLMPAFAKDTLHVGPDGLGFLLSTFGIGAILGLLGLATLGNIKRKGLVILGAGIFSGLGMVALSRATSMSLAIPFVIWIGAMHVLYNAINNTIIQTITPDALRGRVMSIYMLDVGLMPLGSLLAGSLASLDAVPLALLVGGSLTIALILLASIRFKVIRSVA